MPHLYPSLATAGWILSDSICSSSSICCGATQVPGQPSHINTYRAELPGLLALIQAVTFICQGHNISDGHVTVACDNKGAIYQLNNTYPYVPCSIKHADLIRVLHHSHQLCPVMLSFEYIPGHQDELSQLEDLLPLEKLNVMADSLARQELHQLGHLQAPLFLFYLTRRSLVSCLNQWMYLL